MFDDNDIERASTELAAYRNDGALPKILDSYSTLLQDFQRLKSDYEEERNARERYKQIARKQDRKPFVLMLVDGDGYVFHETLIKAGIEGGRKAAQLLDESIRNNLRAKGLEHCDVMVRVYANVAGLSKALSKAGLGGHDARSLAPFIASFNRQFGLYDFVDAGELKENADFKLRSTLRFYADIPSCRQVYFAACHDVGYISELTPYMSDRSRFTLIETPGVKFHDEFRKLNLSVETFRGVFRNAPLDSAPSQSYSKITANSAPVPAPYEAPAPSYNYPPKTSSTVCTFYLKGICKNGNNCQFAHTGGQDKDKGGSNWREKMPSKLGNIEDLPTKDMIPRNCVAVNKEDYRLDPALPAGSLEASRTLKERGRRICNEFHLLGACRNGPNCEYDHTPLSPTLKSGAELLSRSILCSRRGTCRIVDCIKGHVCQHENCSRRNNGGKEFCRLPTMAHMSSFVAAAYVPGITAPHWNGNGNGRDSSNGMDDEDETDSPSAGAAVTV